ncbi:MAG: ABC transporter ATP-binding protein [Desulfotomaculaceae bacterium]
MQGKITLKLDNIRKIYTMGEHKVLALGGVTLTVLQGEMVAIMGASGSGKSTLLNVIGCLDKPTEGTYILDGEDISGLNKDQLASIRNKKFGFVFQTFNLLGRVTVRANVQLPLIYAGMDKKEMAARTEEALQWVGLAGYINHLPSQMSGGQQQRVAIARALVNSPSLILADEPTGALDSKTSVEIMSVIQRLNREKGITVIMVTHDKDISLYCRRLIYLKDGHVVDDNMLADQRDAAADLAALSEKAGAQA